MSASQTPSEFPSAPMPPASAVKARKPQLLKPTLYVHDYINLASVQKCLEDRRSDFVTIGSTTFSGELELESRPYWGFFVLERNHFTLFNHYHAPVKFSYKSRNAVMAHLWRDGVFTDMTSTKFVEVDGLWQLEQLPVLCFAFGQDADTLRSSYVIDDNTIHEYYESTATMDMADLATVAQGKADLCVSHFFVVNRGKEYWAVDTKDPSISYAFGPSTKTRTVSRLVDGSGTVQVLIDEDNLQASTDAHTSQSPKFTLRDINGEEVVEGDRFVLQIPGRSDDDDDNEGPVDIPEGHTMFGEKNWVGAFDSTHLMPRREAMFVGSMDNGSCFGVTVVNDITYLTFEGLFVQIEDDDRSSSIVILSETPSKHNRIHLTNSDDGLIALSRWGAKVPITLEWVKFSCCVYFTDEDSSFEHSTKLRIIKV
ncbi:hypothetical protein H4S04_007164 [Coemansia sp. S16]|nr:hypothetical protein H4S03_009371 [Coemansia sp. S3946]KAJ2042695.1 hypothetical protein H4S04_007164 [Coemansia sp. S16]KAJ2051623.1 hypothetical protein GGI08_005223 [Coemansia sp. S2]KAJ2333077.1 hypothetical protein GGH92_008721 [Coemansia sp. RSA 2673]